jgi:hypothetical protein
VDWKVTSCPTAGPNGVKRKPAVGVRFPVVGDVDVDDDGDDVEEDEPAHLPADDHRHERRPVSLDDRAARRPVTNEQARD